MATIWQWALHHTAILNVIMNTVMVLIWVAYLQIFLVNFLRQRRTVLHIGRGAAKDENARCIVTNMGSEPAYIVGIVADLLFDDRRERALVTDKEEIAPDAVNRPLERTNQGPLSAGEAIDVGSFWELAERARLRLGLDLPMEDLKAMEITAVAASNQGQKLAGGYKCFNVCHQDGARSFQPDHIITKQINSFTRRKKIEAFLNHEGGV
ncbi:MAG: hypothetical protein ACNS61_05840 [Candidatus Wenzhouxiangella sp. M2_3B_020]